MHDANVMIRDTGNNGQNTRTVVSATSYANTRVNIQCCKALPCEVTTTSKKKEKNLKLVR